MNCRSLAEPIQKRGEPAFVAVNEADAAKAGLSSVAEVTIDGHSIQLPVKRTQVEAGTIGLPQGLEGIPFLAAGAWPPAWAEELGCRCLH